MPAPKYLFTFKQEKFFRESSARRRTTKESIWNCDVIFIYFVSLSLKFLQWKSIRKMSSWWSLAFWLRHPWKEYFNDSPQQQRLPLIVINWKILHFFCVPFHANISRGDIEKTRQNYRENCTLLSLNGHCKASFTNKRNKSTNWSV